MKKLLLLIITTCVASLGAWAQTSSVSATITDSTSQAYANGTYDILFRPAPGVPGTPTRSGSAFTQHFSGVLDASGAFAVTLTRNDFIQPAGSQWTFTICPLAASACFTSNQTIAAASVNLTTPLHTVTPIVSVFSLGNIPAAYSSSEIVVMPNSGSFFWNLTTGTFNFWNGASWVAMLLPSANNTFTGSNTVCSLNGTLSGSTTCYATVQAAINALPSCSLINDLNSYTNPPSTYNNYTFNRCGTVILPVGVVNVSSEIDITSPYVTLQGDSSGGTVINWTGTTGCAVSWTTNPFVDDWVGTGGFYNIRIDGFNGSAGTCGLKTWDNTGFHMNNVAITNFNKAGSIGWWEFNASEWNEKYDAQIVLKNNTIDWLAQRGPLTNGGTLGYGRFEITCDVFDSQTCLKVDGGTQGIVELSHSFIHITANLVSNPSNATAVQLINGAVFYDNVFDMHIEAPFGMGTGHEINLASGTTFRYTGSIHQDWASSNVNGNANPGIAFGTSLNNVAEMGFNNGVTVTATDASGVARAFFLKDASNNTYFLGDTNQKTLIFQATPGVNNLALTNGGAQLLNNYPLQWVDSGGVARNVLYMDNLNNVYFYGRAGTNTISLQPTPGTTSLALSGSTIAVQNNNRFKIVDQGTCTMSSGTCTLINLASTYASAQCFVTWTGTGTMTGFLKSQRTTTTIQPASSVGTDTAQVDWACYGN